MSEPVDGQPLSRGELVALALTPPVIAVFVWPQTDALWRGWRAVAWTVGCAFWARCG